MLDYNAAVLLLYIFKYRIQNFTVVGIRQLSVLCHAKYENVSAVQLSV